MPLKSEIRLLNEILPSSVIFTVPVRCTGVVSNESSSSRPQQKSNISETSPPFVLHAATSDSVYLSFSPKSSIRHRINCHIQDGYPREPPLWFTDMGDDLIDSVINSINEMNSLPHLLLDMVKTLVKSLCHVFEIPIPSFLHQLDLDDAFEESDDDESNEKQKNQKGKGDRCPSGASSSTQESSATSSRVPPVGVCSTDALDDDDDDDDEDHVDEGDNLEDLQDLSDDDSQGDSVEFDFQVSDDEICAFDSNTTNDKQAASADSISSTNTSATTSAGTAPKRPEGELSQEHLAVLARVQMRPSTYNIIPPNVKSSSSPSSSRSTLTTRCKKMKEDASSGSDIHATDRLMKELREVFKSDNLRNGVFSVSLEEDNLYEWNVQLHQFDRDSALSKDLVTYKGKHGEDFILLNVTFNSKFPFSPPFIRVVKPPIIGGFVLPGGAICMELLTTQGWSSAYSMESVILQIQATITKGKARINFEEVGGSYTMMMAVKSFMNLESLHARKGWRTAPKSEG